MPLDELSLLEPEDVDEPDDDDPEDDDEDDPDPDDEPEPDPEPDDDPEPDFEADEPDLPAEPDPDDFMAPLPVFLVLDFLVVVGVGVCPDPEPPCPEPPWAEPEPPWADPEVPCPEPEPVLLALPRPLTWPSRDSTLHLIEVFRALSRVPVSVTNTARLPSSTASRTRSGACSRQSWSGR